MREGQIDRIKAASVQVEVAPLGDGGTVGEIYLVYI